MATPASRAVDPVLAGLGALLPNLKSIYTDIHSHPELSMQETRTAGIAEARLREAGFEVTDRNWQDRRRRGAAEW